MASYLILEKNRSNVQRSGSISAHTFLPIIVLLIVILYYFVLLLLSLHQNYYKRYVAGHGHRFPTEEERGYSIDTEGCRIPALKPYDHNIDKLLKGEANHLLPCPKKETAMLDSNYTHVWIIKENLRYHYNSTTDENSGFLNLSLIRCCYQEFHRSRAIMDITSPNIDNRFTIDKCKFFRDIIDVNPNDEFVIVTCHYNVTPVYHKLLAYVPNKSFMSRNGVTPLPDTSSQYNVLVMGLDSVSRLNFHKAMPRTWELLKSLKAVELLGHNKVGDDTWSNGAPLLMGLRRSALQTTCLPYEEAHLDGCPLVWQWFKQAGYYTAFGDDTSKYGIINYEYRSGFYGFPTDYYLHTFTSLAEALGNNYHEFFKGNVCLQERFMYEMLLDYVEDLTKKLANKRLFGFFWNVHSTHQGYNNNAYRVDDSYEKLFKRLHQSGYLGKTIVIFLSDNGVRWRGNPFNTERWRLETRLPFAFVLVPPSFRANYSLAYNSLILNRKRLTTPFDIHKTLLDLIDVKNIADDAIEARSKQYYTKDTGISLFLPIPGNRTCKMADIDDTWCACHRSIKIPVDGAEVKNAAKDLMVHLNTLLSGHRDCASLQLSKILAAMQMKASYGDDTVLKVVVLAEPSLGEFEATMRKAPDGTWKPEGTVTRLNRYEEQSRCVSLYELKLYCFCKGSSNA